MDTILKWFNWGVKSTDEVVFEEKIAELNSRMRRVNEEIDIELKRRECEGFSAYISMQKENLMETKEDHWLIG
ncbi:hypothetical protein [Listeria innocua]|uniref:hypothetical protein n=1 Tax=Listeria innocua TaxID=1642 RepID=UPI00165DD213|nr:hypothetical protein [Listeria innocua]